MPGTWLWTGTTRSRRRSAVVQPSAGWDNLGANLNLVVVRTDPDAGGTSALSAIIVERGTPGITYHSISTSGQRLAPNCEIVFDNARVPAANLIEGTRGNGDLLINRNFA